MCVWGGGGEGRKDLAPSWENSVQHRKETNDPECQANCGGCLRDRATYTTCHGRGTRGLGVGARGTVQRSPQAWL